VNSKLVIIDYGVGNLRSVFNAITSLGIDAQISEQPEDILKAKAVILPGVGAFEDGMKGLREKNLIDPIIECVQRGSPFLGICLGMQLMMTKSFEFGEHAGLGLIEGEVIPFKNKLVNEKYDYKIPHIGWNAIEQSGRDWSQSLLKGVPDQTEFYFVHSYYVKPTSQKDILATTHYANQDFCSVSTNNKNIFGCQFHPEKSSQMGLQMLKNFLGMIQ
jgi:glutamine amidotransferase